MTGADALLAAVFAAVALALTVTRVVTVREVALVALVLFGVVVALRLSGA